MRYCNYIGESDGKVDRFCGMASFLVMLYMEEGISVVIHDCV